MTPYELLAIVAVIAAARVVSRCGRSSPDRRGGARPSRASFSTRSSSPVSPRGFLITFVARTYYIPSGSMLPTLQIHDVLLVDKFEYRFHPPNEGDIVVFPPPVPTPDDFIKRVIGRPGDRFASPAEPSIVNGVPLNEPYIAEHPDYELQIRNYGIYVSYGDGWQRLDPKLGKRSRRDSSGRPRIAFRRTATSCSATIATIPKTRISGVSRKIPDDSRAGQRAGEAAADLPDARFSSSGHLHKPRFFNGAQRKRASVVRLLRWRSVANLALQLAVLALLLAAFFVRLPQVSGTFDGTAHPLRRIRPHQHLRVPHRRAAPRRDRRLPPRRRRPRGLHQTRGRLARATTFASIAVACTSTAAHSTSPTCAIATTAVFRKSWYRRRRSTCWATTAPTARTRDLRTGIGRSPDRARDRRSLAAAHAGRLVTRY